MFMAGTPDGPMGKASVSLGGAGSGATGFPGSGCGVSTGSPIVSLGSIDSISLDDGVGNDISGTPGSGGGAIGISGSAGFGLGGPIGVVFFSGGGIGFTSGSMGDVDITLGGPLVCGSGSPGGCFGNSGPLGCGYDGSSSKPLGGPLVCGSGSPGKGGNSGSNSGPL